MLEVNMLPRLKAGMMGIALLASSAIAAQPEQPRVVFGIGRGAAPEGNGAPVGRVLPGGTAAALGLQEGDLIIAANDRPIRSHADMLEFVRTLRVGESLTVTVTRAGKPVRLSGVASSGPPGMAARSREMAAITGAPISAADARVTAQAFANAVENEFYEPNRGRLYAAALRAHVGRGAYDDIGTVGALAQRLTADVQAVAPDGHLALMPALDQGGGAPRPGAGAAGPQAIEEAKWLSPGIAYVRFTSFPSTPETIAASEQFMRDHAEAETIIFDLRTHRGGSVGETHAIMPFLFDRETALVRTGIRSSIFQQASAQEPLPPFERVVGNRDGVTTVEEFTRPHPTERRLRDARVLVLTSNFTASAAEAFAIGLKGSGRATLIGETTAGAGNSALGFTRIGERFRAFIPSGHAFEPRSGQGWEGTGVAPDVEAPAEQALAVALVRSGLAPAEADRLSRSVHPQGSMQRQRRPAGPVPAR